MDYLFWIIIMSAFIVIEIATVNLVTIWFAFGSLLACIASVIGLNIYWQIAFFAFGSILLLLFTKPIVKKRLTVEKVKTNSDNLIGKTVVVTDDITPDKFAGKIIIGGQEWSAVAQNGEIIKKGSNVCIKAIQGVKLVVDTVDEA